MIARLGDRRVAHAVAEPVVQAARQPEHVAAGADVDAGDEHALVARRARPRARRGSRPSCGTPARRRAAPAARPRPVAARTTKSVSVAAAGPASAPGRVDGVVELVGRPTTRSASSASSPTPAARSRRAWTTQRVARLPLLHLLGRSGSAAGRPRSGRASGRWRPRRRPGRRRRAPPSTTSLHRGGGRHDVVAVDRDVVDAVAGGPPLERRRVLGRRGRELGVAVVLAEEDHRQLPHGGEVDRLVERALGHRAVAEERHRDAAVGRAAAPRSPRPTAIGRPAPTMPLAPKMPMRRIGDVHRAAAPAVRARVLAPSARRTSRAGRGPWPGSGRGRDGSR